MQNGVIEESKDIFLEKDEKEKAVPNENSNNNKAIVSSPQSPNVIKGIPASDTSPEVNQSYHSEVVSKEIINKVISLVFTAKYRQEIHDRLTDFCSDYVYESLKPCLYQEFMAYDPCKEEEREGENDDKALNIFYSNHFIDNNTWREIKEPQKPYIERDASTLMRHKKANEDEEKKYAIKKRNSVLEIVQSPTEHSIKEEKTAGKRVAKLSRKSKLILSSHPKGEMTQESKTSKKDLNPLSLSDKNRGHTNTTNRKKKGFNNKKGEAEAEEEEEVTIRDTNDGIDKNKIIELEAHDLPFKLFTNTKVTEEQLKEYEEMRKNRIIEVARKEEEEKRRKEQEKREYLNSMTIKHVKEIDTQRLTFDPNGKLIPLRLPKIESLGNEFWWSKQIIKELAVFPNEIPKEKPSSSPQKKDQKGDKIKNAVGDNKKKAQNSSLMVIPVKDINTLQDNSSNVIYNTDNNNMARNRYSRFATLSKLNNQPITPAGSNMNIMNPEVGVIISDGLQKKEGSMEFSSKFNKPSMEEFSRIALESMNINYSKQNLLSLSNTNNANRLDESNQYIGYAEKFQSSNNPLIQNAHVSRNSDYNSKGDIPKNRLLTFDNPLIMNSKSQHFKSQNIEGIVLGKHLQTNLKAAIDLVEDTTANQNMMMMMSAESNRLNTELSLKEDFIKERLMRDSNQYQFTEKEDLNMVNAFNSNIIKSKDWGRANVSNNSYAYHRRPVKSNHVRELGLRIVTTKLPRERRLNSGKQINSIR